MSGFGLVLVSVLLGDFCDWQKAQLLENRRFADACFGNADDPHRRCDDPVDGGLDVVADFQQSRHRRQIEQRRGQVVSHQRFAEELQRGTQLPWHQSFKGERIASLALR